MNYSTLSAAPSAIISPLPYAQAIKRLTRSTLYSRVARELESLDGYDKGLLHVLPIAWALRHAEQRASAHLPQDACALVIEGEDPLDRYRARWYGAVQSLAGTKTRWSLHVVATDDETPVRAGLLTVPSACVFKSRPLHATISGFRSLNIRPQIVIFNTVDNRDISLLRELASPWLAEWMKDGTRVLLLGITQAGVALFAQAVRDLGGTADENIVCRLPSVFTSPCVRSPSFLAEITGAPSALDSFSLIARELDPQIDIIAESLCAGDIEGFSPGLSIVGANSSFEGYTTFVLPCLHVCLKTPAQIVDSPAVVLNTSRDGMREFFSGGDGDNSSVGFLEPSDAEAFAQACAATSTVTTCIARFRTALRFYCDYVDEFIETAFGVYSLNDAGLPEPEFSDEDAASAYPLVLPGDELPTQQESHAAAAADVVITPMAVAEPAGNVSERHDADLVEIVPSHPVPAPDQALVDEIIDLRAKLRASADLIEQLRAELRGGASSPAADTLSSLASTIATSGAPAAGAPVDTYPQDWNSLFVWAHRMFGSALDFTSRARRVARKTLHSDIPFIAQCIELLAVKYRAVRLVGDPTSRKDYEDALRRLGVKVGPTGAALDNHRTIDVYTASWEGRRYVLDVHLQGSSSRDKRVGLRIYFCWLPAQAKVLVGHLPTHLPNSHT